ncbi:hypothetical protein BDZ97DRAFT_1859469 [Flammula alnicola]|nr:hypothetical protein BDZ97DRAFT_1859469 [Flammula alnicola]
MLALPRACQSNRPQRAHAENVAISAKCPKVPQCGTQVTGYPAIPFLMTALRRTSDPLEN